MSGEALVRLAARLGLDRWAYRIWRYSPRGLCRLYQHHRFDRELGVDTRGYGDSRYEPTPAGVFKEILDGLPVDFSRFVFIDIGSGKGKAVLLASGFPFKRIIGVERFADLNRIAERNIALFRERGGCGPDIELVCLDAAEYPIPLDPAVIYFFNPFPEETLAKVVAHIESSLTSRPRPLYVVYYAPILKRGMPWDRRRLFDQSEHFEVVQDERTYTVYAGVMRGSSVPLQMDGRGINASARAGSRDLSPLLGSDRPMSGQ